MRKTQVKDKGRVFWDFVYKYLFKQVNNVFNAQYYLSVDNLLYS